MLLSPAFGIVMALAAAQGMRDPTTAPRNAFTSCLRAFMEKSVTDRISIADFDSALPQQCADQERAFREAVVARERGFRTPAAEVEEIIGMELEDARTNIKQKFEMSTTPA